MLASLGTFILFSTQFLCQAICTQEPRIGGTQVIVGSMSMGYISDTARNRTHNLFRPKREPMPLGHNDGRMLMEILMYVAPMLTLISPSL